VPSDLPEALLGLQDRVRYAHCLRRSPSVLPDCSPRFALR
jgi:hypothetical protein